MNGGIQFLACSVPENRADESKSRFVEVAEVVAVCKVEFLSVEMTDNRVGDYIDAYFVAQVVK